MGDNSIICAGIDTSKDTLDAAIHQQTHRLNVKNRGDGYTELATWLKMHGVVRIGIEATGGYERGVVQHLRAAGFVVVVFQPLQVKAFGRVRLQRAKNDKIDAELIAACTFHLKDDNKLAPDPRLTPLADHLTFLEQIEEEKARYKTRLEHTQDPRHQRLLNADIHRLERRRANEILLIVKAIRQHADLAKRLDLVASIQGIGLRTAIALVVRMPELGKISDEQAASLAGLAPFDHDSGRHRGERHIAGGRGRVRRSLYAAALPASHRWNPALIALYNRLIAKGKTHKVALIACARKLLIFANAVVRRGKPWETRAKVVEKAA
jgi:transposase